MTDFEKLQAIAAYLRAGCSRPTEAFANVFGLTLGRWRLSKCAERPEVLRTALADFLDELAERLAGPVSVCLGDRRYRNASAESVVDPVLDQLGGAEIALGVCGSAAVAHVDGDGADSDRVVGADQALVLEADDDGS